MTIWGALAGGFVGTLVLTTLLQAASAVGLTRVDLPFLLGTALTGDRIRAKAVGYALHFIVGLAFALLYLAIFAAIGQSSWWLGGALGLVHGVFAVTALVSTLLPLVHPRMATPLSATGSNALLEPPGFMMLNYGARTPLVTIVGHIAYGAIVGGFVSLSG